MKNVEFIIIFLFMIAVNSHSSNFVVSNRVSEIKVYDNLELNIDTDLKIKNPYDYDEINITGEFISPDNSKKIVDAFYCESFGESKKKNFKIRFTPDKPGKWKYRIKVKKNKEVLLESKLFTFECKKNPDKNGFIKLSDTDFLFTEFSNKKPFFPVGLNIAWSASEDVYADYEKWISKLKENGGNFIRIWMANWFLGIEWDGKLKDYSGRQKQAYLLDKIIKLCEENGIYIMLCLLPHGEFSTTHNSNWDKNPYNKINGGILERPEEFFINEKAKKIFKNRLRYIIARYSYSTSIFAWELFNEVDLTDKYDTFNALNWHREMLNEIKNYDIYKHLKTTSFSDPYKDDEIWNLKQIDFTQTHIYGLKDAAEAIYEISKYKIEKFSKPHIISEFGIDVNKETIEKGIDEGGIYMHNALWSGIFTLSFGSPMAWWWEIYVDRFNLFSLYKPLTDFIKDIKWIKNNYYEIKDKNVYISNAKEDSYRDLIIYPIEKWERAKEDRFTIKNNGIVVNKPYFPAFLFGKSKVDMKNDPVIKITNEKPGKLIIKLKRVSHDNILSVIVNDAESLRENVCAKDFPKKRFFDEWKIYQADIDKEYSVDLPVGDNEIILKNDGEDWILIDYIKFTDAVKAKYAPVFISGIQSNKDAYIWIKNEKFRWDNPEPESVKNAILNIYDLLSGRYVIKFYDTWNGEVIKEIQDIVDNDILLLEIPEVKKDIAISVRRYGE